MEKTDRAEAENEELLEEPKAEQQKQLKDEVKTKDILEKIAQKLLLEYQERAAKARPFNKASFPETIKGGQYFKPPASGVGLNSSLARKRALTQSMDRCTRFLY